MDSVLLPFLGSVYHLVKYEEVGTEVEISLEQSKPLNKNRIFYKIDWNGGATPTRIA